MSGKHAPDSLKYQWRLLGLVMRSGWATSLDKSVAYEIIDNYYSKFGNSRASLGYLQKATGSGRRHVVASCRRLAENGIITVVRQGVGTRPTEYQLHFELAAEKPSGSPEDTTNSAGASGSLEVTTGSSLEGTTSTPSGSLEDTESVLPVAAYKAGVQDRMIDPAPASPPLSVGLMATDAEGSGGGFEELWKAYGHRQKKADAKAAYLKAAPDADQHAHMVVAAKAWFAAWEAQGKAEAPRFTLAKWIEREEFECDPPSAFKPKERKERKEKPKPTPKASNDNAPDEDDDECLTGPMICDVGPFTPFGRFTATITGSTVQHVEPNMEKVVLDLTWNERGLGPDAKHTLYFQHPDPEIQGRGRMYLKQLAKFFDIDDLTDTEQLHGRRVTCVINNRLAISYGRAA